MAHPPEKKEHVVEERDAKSRTVEVTRITETVEPDVDVNERPEIMGDEGPVAESNPHNKSEDAS